MSERFHFQSHSSGHFMSQYKDLLSLIFLYEEEILSDFKVLDFQGPKHKNWQTWLKNKTLWWKERPSPIVEGEIKNTWAPEHFLSPLLCGLSYATRLLSDNELTICERPTIEKYFPLLYSFCHQHLWLTILTSFQIHVFHFLFIFNDSLRFHF